MKLPDLDICCSRSSNNAVLNLEEMDLPGVGIVAGSGGASSAAQIEASDIARDEGPKRIGPMQLQNDGEYCFSYSGDNSQA